MAATYTTNLNLAKPATSDPVDVSVLNSNMDKVDAACGTITGSITMASGWTLGTSEAIIRQYGKVVVVRFYATKDSSIASAGTENVGTISGVALPSSNVRNICYTGTDAWVVSNTGYVILDNTGVIGVRSNGATDDTVQIELVYIVA